MSLLSGVKTLVWLLHGTAWQTAWVHDKAPLQNAKVATAARSSSQQPHAALLDADSC